MNKRTFFNILIASPLAALVKPFRKKPFDLMDWMRSLHEIKKKRLAKPNAGVLYSKEIVDGNEVWIRSEISGDSIVHAEIIPGKPFHVMTFNG